MALSLFGDFSFPALDRLIFRSPFSKILTKVLIENKPSIRITKMQLPRRFQCAGSCHLLHKGSSRLLLPPSSTTDHQKC